MIFKKSFFVEVILLVLISTPFISYASSENSQPSGNESSLNESSLTETERNELIKSFLAASQKSATQDFIDNVVALTDGYTRRQFKEVLIAIINTTEENNLDEFLCLEKLEEAAHKFDSGHIKEQKIAQLERIAQKLLYKPIPFDPVAFKRDYEFFEANNLLPESERFDITKEVMKLQKNINDSLNETRYSKSPTAEERFKAVKEVLFLTEVSSPESLITDIVELTDQYPLDRVKKIVKKMIRKSKTSSLDQSSCIEILRKAIDYFEDEEETKKLKFAQIKAMVKKLSSIAKVVISKEEQEAWLKAREEVLKELLNKHTTEKPEQHKVVENLVIQDLIQISVNEAFDLKVFKKMKQESLETEKRKKVASQLFSEEEQMLIMTRKAKQNADEILQEYIAELKAKKALRFSDFLIGGSVIILSPVLLPIGAIIVAFSKEADQKELEEKKRKVLEEKAKMLAELVTIRKLKQSKVWKKYAAELRGLIVKKMLSKEKEEVLEEVLQRYEPGDEEEEAAIKEAWQNLLDETQKITIEIIKAEKQRQLAGKLLSKEEQEASEKEIEQRVAKVFEKYMPDMESFLSKKYPLVEDIYLPNKDRIYETVEKLRNGEFEKGSPRGLIFYGPPGLGKTSMAEAIANEAGCPILIERAQILLDKWVGAGQQAVKSIFSEARKKAAETGKGVIIFIDELQALAPGTSNRNIGLGDQYSGQSYRNTLTHIWTEYDDCVKNNDNIFLIIACNNFDRIDERIRQRIEHIEFSQPDINAVTEILYRKAQHHNIFLSESELNEYAKKMKNLSGRELNTFFEQTKKFIKRGRSREEALKLAAEKLLKEKS